MSQRTQRRRSRSGDCQSPACSCKLRLLSSEHENNPNTWSVQHLLGGQEVKNAHSTQYWWFRLCRTWSKVNGEVNLTMCSDSYHDHYWEVLGCRASTTFTWWNRVKPTARCWEFTWRKTSYGSDERVEMLWYCRKIKRKMWFELIEHVKMIKNWDLM